MDRTAHHKEGQRKYGRLSSEWRSRRLINGRAIMWDILCSGYLLLLFSLTLTFRSQWKAQHSGPEFKLWSSGWVLEDGASQVSSWWLEGLRQWAVGLKGHSAFRNKWHFIFMKFMFLKVIKLSNNDISVKIEFLWFLVLTFNDILTQFQGEPGTYKTWVLVLALHSTVTRYPTDRLSGLDLSFPSSTNQRAAEEMTQDNGCPECAANGT